ncbi:MAG: YihY/virulence factor BrkB family protein [Tatlockia sp.]|nr:YihY/virulence factor BrkB family protein [Tatlockia sp.]
MVKNFMDISKQVFAAWSKDRLASLAAALAYYTIFSLTPILLLFIALAGLFLGEEAAQGKVVEAIGNLVGQDTGQQIQTMIKNANKPATAIFAQIVSIVVLLFGASGVFTELQNGLNTIWDVKAKKEAGFFHMIRRRFLSFTMVLTIIFLLLVSLVFGIFLTSVSSFMTSNIGIELIAIIISQIFSFGIYVLLFGLMFKVLPDKDLEWKNVWVGAVITTILFEIGKYILGIYLSQVKVTSSFGASGSLVVLLIWVYYTAQIFFIGAEITKILTLKDQKT